MRLLLAEDEVDLSEALAAALRHNHYSVDAVYDGESALAFLESQEYDGILLDVMMPKLDGIQVLKRLREKGITTPVLLLTAKTSVEDRVLGLDCGADDYLGKPFAMQELLARIRAMTRRNPLFVDNRLRYGNISLDRGTFELMVEEKKTRLANKEFQMLEMLMNNPGQIISTPRFLEKIWGYDSDTEINVVWVYISYLRKKLSLLGADVEIKAIRNQGYSLVVAKPKEEG